MATPVVKKTVDDVFNTVNDLLLQFQGEKQVVAGIAKNADDAKQLQLANATSGLAGISPTVWVIVAAAIGAFFYFKK